MTTEGEVEELAAHLQQQQNQVVAIQAPLGAVGVSALPSDVTAVTVDGTTAIIQGET